MDYEKVVLIKKSSQCLKPINKRVKLDCSFNFYFSIACILPISTMFQSYFSYVNIFLVCLMILTQFYFYLKHGISRKSAFFVLAAILFLLYPFLLTDGSLLVFNHIFYFPVFLLYLSFVFTNKEMLILFVKKRQKFIKNINFLWISLIFLSAFFKSSWDNSNFISFYGSIFRLGPGALMIEGLIACCLTYKKNKAFIPVLILIVTLFFLGNSRTYFAIGIVAFLFCIYIFIGNKRQFFVSFIILSIIGLFVFFNSPIYQKLISSTTNGYYSGIDQFSSSRSVFWKADLEGFWESPFFNKIFGDGYNFVYLTNFRTVKAYIWAHNDFIQIVCTYGFIGLLFYFLTFFSIFSSFITRKVNIYLFLSVLFIFFFNAFFNMLFTYFCSMLSIPFFIFALSNFKGK